MNIILMEHDTDCEVAAIATACQVSYDEAESALGWRKLPLGAENPVFGNPLNLHKALLKLGFWKDELTLSELLAGKGKPGQTIVLLKKSVTQQHWTVYFGRIGEQYGFLWGNSTTPVWLTSDQVSRYFLNDGPCNTAFTVYPTGLFELIWRRIQMWFNRS